MLRNRSRLALLGACQILLAPFVHAQRLVSPWIAGPPVTLKEVSRSQPWLSGSALLSHGRRTDRRTYSVEGAVLGGIVLGFLGAVTGLGLCHFDDPCPHPAPFVIGGLAVGGAAGAAVGARIGGALSKQ
jgi:hypothetical protein